jgi:hypothetical protein
MQALGIGRLGFETGQTIRALLTVSTRLGDPVRWARQRLSLASRVLMVNNARAARAGEEIGENPSEFWTDTSLFGQSFHSDSSD